MAMSALSTRPACHLVERFDTSVAEMELKYANNKLIGDDQHPNPQAGDFRKIMAGSIPGSDYYIVGGITELNFNIRSENANGDGGGTATNATTGTAGGSMYVMNVGLDMRLVEHQHAGSRGRHFLPEADHRPPDLGRRVRLPGHQLLRRQRRRKRAGADPARRALGDRARGAGNDHPHLSRPGRRLRLPLGTAQDPLRESGEAPYYPRAAAYPAPILTRRSLMRRSRPITRRRPIWAHPATVDATIPIAATAEPTRWATCAFVAASEPTCKELQP